MAHSIQELTQIAATTAEFVDPIEFRSALQVNELDNPSYLAVNHTLRRIRWNNPNAADIYTYTVSEAYPDAAIVVAVTSAVPLTQSPTEADQRLANQQSDDCFVPPEQQFDIGSAAHEDDNSNLFIQKALQGLESPTAARSFLSNSWGKWLVAFAPIVDENGQVIGGVGVSACASEIAMKLDQATLKIALVMGSITLAMLLVMGIIVAWLTAPIVEITQALKRFSEQHRAEVLQFPKRHIADEFTDLQSAFVSVVQDMNEREAELRKIANALPVMLDREEIKTQAAEVTETELFAILKKYGAAARRWRAEQAPVEPTDSADDAS